MMLPVYCGEMGCGDDCASAKWSTSTLRVNGTSLKSTLAINYHIKLLESNPSDLSQEAAKRMENCGPRDDGSWPAKTR
jgi:hypothetical protein